jgi:hypothetical protein
LKWCFRLQNIVKSANPTTSRAAAAGSTVDWPARRRREVGRGRVVGPAARGVQLRAHAEQPLRAADVHRRLAVAQVPPLDVALQVEFEKQILKPVFHLIGFRLWV